MHVAPSWSMNVPIFLGGTIRCSIRQELVFGHVLLPARERHPPYMLYRGEYTACVTLAGKANFQGAFNSKQRNSFIYSKLRENILLFKYALKQRITR